MSVAAEILRSWTRPRKVIRARLQEGVREDRAIAVLVGACLLIFIAQWPRLMRLAEQDPSVPFLSRVAGAMFAWLFLMPLACYALAGLTHVLAKPLGGKGSWYGARIALFWSLLAAAPLWLLNGIVAGALSDGPILAITGAIALAAFLLIWLLTLIEVETGTPAE